MEDLESVIETISQYLPKDKQPEIAQKLKSIVLSLNEQIISAEQTAYEIISANSQLDAKLEVIQTENEDLRLKTQQHHTHIESIRSEYKEELRTIRESKKHDLETLASTHSTHCAQLEEQHDQMMKDLHNAHSEIVSKLQKQLEAQEDSLAALPTLRDTLMVLSSSLESERSAHKKAVEQASLASVQHQSAIRTISERLAEALESAASSKAIASRVDLLERQIQHLSSDLVSRTRRVSTVEEENRVLKNKAVNYVDKRMARSLVLGLAASSHSQCSHLRRWRDVLSMAGELLGVSDEDLKRAGIRDITLGGAWIDFLENKTGGK
eukprot:gnl/Dysnectes_brevis/5995_a8982_452.p1 GENE.gnl/Dysnectes_brevis/5995_a8982_452~~gnl/Dysnectes_brevis/5995_a8982_452.p1  ORF type:complete len:324 (-),score=27.93 gnl/Dysnectes_brevis/5995_a8982_452:46-1017(-)